MKIEVWTPTLDRATGGNLYDRELAEALHRRNHEVLVRQFHLGRPRPEMFRGAPAAGTRAVLQDELLHASFRPLNRLLRLRPGRPAIAAVVHHLSSDERERPSPERQALRLREESFLLTVDGVVAPSRASARAAARLRGSAVPQVVAPPGRDRVAGAPLPAALPTDREIEARAREPGPLRVLFVGSLTRRKRLPELLAALRTAPSVRLTVVGGGEAEPDTAASVRERAAEFGERVEFRGEIAGEALVEELRQSHLLAVPSDLEGFGLVYLEAFAFGLPVVAAEAGGAGELVREDETGWLVAPGSGERTAARIADCLGRVAADRGRLAEMGRRAAAVHREWPTWEESAARVEEMLRRLPVAPDRPRERSRTGAPGAVRGRAGGAAPG